MVTTLIIILALLLFVLLAFIIWMVEFPALIDDLRQSASGGKKLVEFMEFVFSPVTILVLIGLAIIKAVLDVIKAIAGLVLAAMLLPAYPFFWLYENMGGGNLEGVIATSAGKTKSPEDSLMTQWKKAGKWVFKQQNRLFRFLGGLAKGKILWKDEETASNTSAAAGTG